MRQHGQDIPFADTLGCGGDGVQASTEPAGEHPGGDDADGDDRDAPAGERLSQRGDRGKGEAKGLAHDGDPAESAVFAETSAAGEPRQEARAFRGRLDDPSPGPAGFANDGRGGWVAPAECAGVEQDVAVGAVHGGGDLFTGDSVRDDGELDVARPAPANLGRKDAGEAAVSGLDRHGEFHEAGVRVAFEAGRQRASQFGVVPERAEKRLLAGSAEPGSLGSIGVFEQTPGGRQNAAGGVGEADPSEVRGRFDDRLEQPPTFTRRRVVAPQGVERGGVHQRAVALVECAVDLVAQLERERVERGAFGGLEFPLQQRAGDPDQQRGEERATHRDQQCGARAQAAARVEDRPPRQTRQAVVQIRSAIHGG